jgi:hypothetical protein
MKKIVSPILALRAKKGKEIITKKIERKQMNILTDELPEKIKIDGEEIKINTDFRNVLLYFRLLKDKDLDETEKLEISINLFFSSVPKDLETAIKYINEEYIPNLPMRKARKTGQRFSEKPVFDFGQDADLIFASFWQAYKINLSKEKMHWKIFKALFDGLGEDTALRRVMEFRRMKPNDMPKERRAELMELQKDLSIKPHDDNENFGHTRSAKEIEKELLEELNNG